MIIVWAAIMEQTIPAEVIHCGSIGDLMITRFFAVRALELDAQMLGKQIAVGRITLHFVISVSFWSLVRCVNLRLGLSRNRG